MSTVTCPLTCFCLSQNHPVLHAYMIFVLFMSMILHSSAYMILVTSTPAVLVENNFSHVEKFQIGHKNCTFLWRIVLFVNKLHIVRGEKFIGKFCLWGKTDKYNVWMDASIYRARGILYLSGLDSLEHWTDKKGLIHSSHIWGYTMLWSIICSRGDNAGLIVWKD